MLHGVRVSGVSVVELPSSDSNSGPRCNIVQEYSSSIERMFVIIKKVGKLYSEETRPSP
jgi:hypothetical protein